MSTRSHVLMSTRVNVYTDIKALTITIERLSSILMSTLLNVYSYFKALYIAIEPLKLVLLSLIVGLTLAQSV